MFIVLVVDNPFADVEQKRREYPISMVNLFLFGVVTGFVVLGVVRLHSDYLTRAQLRESKANLKSFNTALELYCTPIRLPPKDEESQIEDLPTCPPVVSAPGASSRCAIYLRQAWSEPQPFGWPDPEKPYPQHAAFSSERSR